MKKIVLMICTLVLGHTLVASGIKIGLSTDPPTYKQYSKGMNLGVQVGDETTYKHYSESTKVGVQVGDPEIYQAKLPLVFKDYKEHSPIDMEAAEFGAMVGFLFSSLTGDFTSDLNYTGNILFGIYATIAITSLFTIMPQLYYVGLGAGVKDSSSNQKLRLGYLMLPILLYYAITSQFRVGLGPYFAALLSARDKGDGYNEDVKDIFKGFDFGLTIGLIYKVTADLGFSLAYARGLSNLRESGNSKQHNTAIMITAFYNLSNLWSLSPKR